MRRDKLELYVHFVWATWDRQPLIQVSFERRLHRFIEAVAQEMHCSVLAINGIEDHVHVLLKLPSTVTIAELVKRMKGASSHFVNEEILAHKGFKWQGSYGAFSVSRQGVPQVIEYFAIKKSIMLPTAFGLNLRRHLKSSTCRRSSRRRPTNRNHRLEIEEPSIRNRG